MTVSRVIASTKTVREAPAVQGGAQRSIQALRQRSLTPYCAAYAGWESPLPRQPRAILARSSFVISLFAIVI